MYHENIFFLISSLACDTSYLYNLNNKINENSFPKKQRRKIKYYLLLSIDIA